MPNRCYYVTIKGVKVPWRLLYYESDCILSSLLKMSKLVLLHWIKEQTGLSVKNSIRFYF